MMEYVVFDVELTTLERASQEFTWVTSVGNFALGIAAATWVEWKLNNNTDAERWFWMMLFVVGCSAILAFRNWRSRRSVVDDIRSGSKDRREPALTYEESMTETRRYAADHPEWAAYFREKHGREPGVVPAAEPDHGYIGFAPFYISEQQFLATWGNDWSGNPVKITITPTRQASSDIELLVSRGERAPAVPDLEKLAEKWETMLPEYQHCARELREALKRGADR